MSTTDTKMHKELIESTLNEQLANGIWWKVEYYAKPNDNESDILVLESEYLHSYRRNYLTCEHEQSCFFFGISNHSHSDASSSSLLIFTNRCWNRGEGGCFWRPWAYFGGRFRRESVSAQGPSTKVGSTTIGNSAPATNWLGDHQATMYTTDLGKIDKSTVDTSESRHPRRHCRLSRSRHQVSTVDSRHLASRHRQVSTVERRQWSTLVDTLTACRATSCATYMLLLVVKSGTTHPIWCKVVSSIICVQLQLVWKSNWSG